MTIPGKQAVKELLGQIPFTVELYWLLRQGGKPLHSHFSLKHLQEALPELMVEANSIRQNYPVGKKVFIFATLHYWIEHSTLLGIALAAQGHQVTLGFMPYSDWQQPINRFDLRRQNVYAKKVLKEASPLIDSVSFLDNQRIPFTPLPHELMEAVQQVSSFDTQYTLQIEDIDPTSEIYRMRYERNIEAARAALVYLQNNRPELVIVPNGTIQELGIVHRVAKFLKIPTVTYEFSDQRQRIWLAQNSEVMRQDTDLLWKARQDLPLTEHQLERIHTMLNSRQRAALWENFARRWQETPTQGGTRTRQDLGLDERPVVLLATNVLGDSLTLGRHLFSKTMSEWISRTVQYFAGRPDIQLIIRVHPGEILTHGLSMSNVVHQVLPRLPEHIRLIGPKEKINTYDLVEVADLGLVYTTTVGLEMAMDGLPVVVAAKTHYRGRGFTNDPDSWVTYFKMLGHILEKPSDFRLTREQVEDAWKYAYRFFFEFPRPFPWHLVRMWDDYKNHPLSSVLGEAEKEQFAATFRYLVGETLDWKEID